jgi:hypothetical protein
MSAATSVHSHGDLTSSEVSVYYAARVPRLRQSGHEWRGPCPIHGGKDDNFCVKAETGCWYCHSQCGRGSSIFDLEMALTNVDFPAAANEVCRIVGRPVDKESEMKWGLPDWSHRYLRERIDKVERENNWKHTAVYSYFEDGGRLSYVKVRFIDKQNDKTFRLWAVSSKGGWVPRKKSGKQPLLYRLNTLASADEIFLVNGEKAADRGATELGIVTTCAPDGEGHWRDDFIRPLTGKVVRIVIDRDKKGEAHGKTVSEALAPHAREVKVIRLPGLPTKGDLWDWIESGGTLESLTEIVARTPAVVHAPLMPRSSAPVAAPTPSAPSPRSAPG